jgi:hypothetical protein
MLYAARRPKIRSSNRQNLKLSQEYFLPAAINEVDGLRHWNDNSPPSLPPSLPLITKPPTLILVQK